MTAWRKVFVVVFSLFTGSLACSIGSTVAIPTPNNAPIPPSVVPPTIALAPTDVPASIPALAANTSTPSVTATLAAPTATFVPLAIVNPSGTPGGNQCTVVLADPKNFVKIRSGPGFDFEAVAILESYSPAIGTSGPWIEVPLGQFSTTGWVSSTVTKLAGPCQAVPTVVFTPKPGN